ncbi:retrovirus-related pol polyprotein from transposon TNT 1-94 [Tanacetum coccineum]
MPGCSWRGHLRGVHIHYCPGVLEGDTCDGYIFITARVFLEGTPAMGTYGFHYCLGVLGGDTYDGELKDKLSTLEKNKGVDIDCAKCHTLKIENEKLKEESTRLNKFEKSTHCLNEMLNNQKPSGDKLGLGFNSFEASSSGTKEIKFVKAQKKASPDGGNRKLFSTYKAYNGGNVIFGSNLCGNIIGKGEFCNANGITRNFSAPRTPQSNGVVDRKNRTLKEMSRTMLNDQSLPQKFWCNAIDTSTYILNRILIRAILGKTPYELLRGYSQNSKAYIILNKHTRKVEESLNVTFDETPPPSKTSPLVDDDLDEEEAIKVTEKKNLENDIVDETLEIDEIVNIKESRNHPLENVIGNLNQRTLRSQAQNQNLSRSKFGE